MRGSYWPQRAYFLIEERTTIIEQIMGTYADKCPNEGICCIFQERETWPCAFPVSQVGLGP